jgi:hypothetical protein
VGKEPPAVCPPPSPRNLVGGGTKRPTVGFTIAREGLGGFLEGLERPKIVVLGLIRFREQERARREDDKFTERSALRSRMASSVFFSRSA